MVVGGEHRGRIEAKVWLIHFFFRLSDGYLSREVVSLYMGQDFFCSSLCTI